MNVFADTSALVALFRIDDPNHKKAKAIAKDLKDVTPLFSNYIFLETVTVLSQKIGKDKTIQAVKLLQEDYTQIRIEPEIDTLAWEIFKKQKSKDVSFIDCTSFALFEKGVFDKAFSFDRDFSENKIPLLV